MGYLSEKAAYLKGLAEGLDIKNDTKEGKLLNAIIEVLDEMALEVDDMVIIQEDMQGQLDDVDNDLADLEDAFFELEDDLDDLDEFEDEDEFEDDLDDELEEMEEYSFECPKCGDVIYFNPEMVDDDVKFIVCPNCGTKIELEFDCDTEE
ncbi:MAG: hypothetical protein IJO83_02350 [Clostridia bacterium]|nr:hypothetical protein [Clostridia bacterium]